MAERRSVLFPLRSLYPNAGVQGEILRPAAKYNRGRTVLAAEIGTSMVRKGRTCRPGPDRARSVASTFDKARREPSAQHAKQIEWGSSRGGRDQGVALHNGLLKRTLAISEDGNPSHARERMARFAGRTRRRRCQRGCRARVSAHILFPLCTAAWSSKQPL